jgi:hypothetical protein
MISGAVEGDLDEVLLRRIFIELGLSLSAVYGRRGKAHLLQSLAGYNAAAEFLPWVVVIDLDRDCDCAPTCVAQWLPRPAAKMCIRIAVRAAEAWLLADRERIAEFLSISRSLIPADPDRLSDPKATLIDLARRSRKREVREQIPPRPGSGRKVGPQYTGAMISFIENREIGWRLKEAAGRSDSLSRCIERLHAFGALHADIAR